MHPSKLERAILDWIAIRQPGLATRLAAAEVMRRDYSGPGWFVYLSSEDEPTWDRPPLDGPLIQSSMLEFDGGSILWLQDGEPACLEIYAFGNHFPERLDWFQLSDAYPYG